MRRLWIAGLLATAAFAQDAAKDPVVSRGKYLAEEVAKCQTCHTPQMDNGDYIKSQWMKGSSLGFTPVSNPANWKSKAPDISANSPIMKRWGDEGMTRFLETGRNPRGSKPGSPMPVFTLSHEDAAAVTAFLKTIQ